MVQARGVCLRAGGVAHRLVCSGRGCVEGSHRLGEAALQAAQLGLERADPLFPSIRPSSFVIIPRRGVFGLRKETCQ